MIVVCPACQARFQYDESRFGTSLSKRFKCPKCAHLFEVVNPALPSTPPPETLSRPLPAAMDEPTAAASALPPLPPDTPHVPMARTTARRDRDAMLAAAGIAPLRPGLRISLAFLTGPQASMVQVLEQPIVTIGREEGDVITRDPETSRRHAQLEIRNDGTVWLSDLNSTNGTLVNGERITGAVELASQQEFTCGNSTFMLLIRRTDETPLT